MIFKSLVSILFLVALKLDPTTSELSLPFPSLIQEIKPTLSIYSTSGDPPCFLLDSGITVRDIVHIAEGHGAWKTQRVIFITHGYRDSIAEPWLHVLKNALVGERPQTVVLLDWGGGANLPHIKYKKAAGNIRSVGMWLGDIAAEIRKMHPKMYIWGIGHNLGAHLMGVAGSASKEAFDRITGLDPAGPFFEDKNEDLRLQRGNAELVDVVHSDGCSIKTNSACWVTVNNHYATLLPLGNIDFYPGFGELNPTTHPLDIDEGHKRAVNLFIVSIMHRGLFKTNETIDGTPGPGMQGTLQRIRTVNVVAEMGYWLETGFVPTPVDSRVNFYIPPETLKVVDRMGDLIKSRGVMRHRRDLVKAIDCVVVPGAASRLTVTIYSLGILGTCLVLGFIAHQFVLDSVVVISSVF